MHDDHFLVIEAAQSWVDGVIVRAIPGCRARRLTDGHSLLYGNAFFLLFKFFNLLHFTDPVAKMFVVRLLHAAASVYAVWLT
ncbi:MAG: hypothetical protein U0Z17_06740 [Bacteroidales bacterium]